MAMFCYIQMANHEMIELIIALVLLVGYIALFCINRCRRTAAIEYYVLLAVFAVLLVTIGVVMNSHLPSDTQIVYDSALYYLREGNLDGEYQAFSTFYPQLGFERFSDYYCRYYNNIFMLLILIAIYRVFGWFSIDVENAGQLQLVAVVVTSLGVLLAVYLICQAIYKYTDSLPMRENVLIAFIFFSPLYYSVPNIYTDVWVVLPIAMQLFLYAEYYKHRRNKTLLIIGVAAAVSALLKVTGLIPFIAFLISSMLSSKISMRQKVQILIIPVIILAIIMFMFSTWYHSSPVFDFSRQEELYYPWQTWVCFGSHGNGMYSYEDALLTYQTEYENRGSIMWEQTLRNYKERGFTEQVSFFENKFVMTWGDGQFDGAQYTEWPYSGSLLTYWLTQPRSTSFKIIRLFSNSYMIAIYLAMTITNGVTALREKKENEIDSVFFNSVAFFGFILYLGIFESAPRRALPAMIFAIIEMVLLSDRIGGIINSCRSKSMAK